MKGVRGGGGERKGEGERKGRETKRLEDRMAKGGWQQRGGGELRRSVLDVDKGGGTEGASLGPEAMAGKMLEEEEAKG